MKEHWTHIFSTLPYYEFFVIFNVCFRILSCIVFYVCPLLLPERVDHGGRLQQV